MRVSSVLAAPPQSRQSPCMQELLNHTAHPGHVLEPGPGPAFSCTAFLTARSHRALGDSAFHLKDIVPLRPSASLPRGSPPKTPDTGQHLAQKAYNKGVTSSSHEKAAHPILQSIPLFRQSVITNQQHVEV